MFKHIFILLQHITFFFIIIIFFFFSRYAVNVMLLILEQILKV